MSTPEAQHGQPVGLVLSGGGARVSFQLGALRYLYDVVGISPSVITATSAGAILGAVLAQHRDRTGQRMMLARLVELWLEMDSGADMFTELPWFTRLRQRGPVWVEAFERQQRRQGALGRSFRRVSNRRPTPTSPSNVAAAEVTAAAGAAAADRVAAGRSGEKERHEPAWSPAKLVESFELLRTMGRAGTDLEQIVLGAQRERSMFRPGPLVDRLLEPENFTAERVAGSGVVLRIAVVGLESGQLHYVTEDGRVVDRDNRPLPDRERVELSQAVRASCAIPMIFPPVLLGEENYVDGGIRESLPAEIAMTHLGVDTCYAIVAGPDGVAREDSYRDKDMLSIMLRTTTGIMSDEVQRDEAVAAARAGAIVISPEFDVHDTLTVDPGLVGIAVDYGYLRAAEVHRAATPEQVALTREIVELRREIWQVEEGVFGPPETEATTAGPAEARIAEAAELGGRKWRLRDLVARVPADRLPPGAAGWWRTWERHAFQIPHAPTWVPADAR